MTPGHVGFQPSGAGPFQPVWFQRWREDEIETSQDALGKRLGYKRPTISRIENGTLKPTERFWKVFAGEFPRLNWVRRFFRPKAVR